MGLGIGGFTIAWVPMVSLISLPLCGIGLILGGWALFVAMLRERTGLRSAIGGVTICAASAIAIVATTNAGISTQGGGDRSTSLPASRADESTDGPVNVAKIILHMYPTHVRDEKRLPKFRGKTVELSNDPRANVRLAIQFAQQGQRGLALDKALEQATALMSEDAVTTFLVRLDNASFNEIADPSSIFPIKIPRSAFDAWSHEAGSQEDDEASQWYFRMIERKNDLIEIRASPEYATMIDAAFFATI